MQPEDYLAGYRPAYFLGDEHWVPPSERDLQLLQELKEMSKNVKVNLTSNPRVNPPSEEFMAFHQELRLASDRIVEMHIAKPREIGTHLTMYKWDHVGTLTFDIEAYPQ